VLEWSTGREFPYATSIDGMAWISVGVAGVDDMWGCGARAPGYITCWGTNESGQLGNGTTNPTTATGGTYSTATILDPKLW
jgi:hypothetical protein